MRNSFSQWLGSVLSRLVLMIAPWLCAGGEILTGRSLLEAQDQVPDVTASPVADDRQSVPEISDHPRAIDPAEFLSAKLTQKVTVDLRTASVAEVAEWLRAHCELTVLIQNAELEDEGIHVSDPVSDWLENEPVYLLLDRLRMLGIGWYFEGDIVYLTARSVADERQVTTPYFLGELLDSGYAGSHLLHLVETLVEPRSWENNGGNGRINLIGDMIFVRNTEKVQRKIQALLVAIPKHGRQTLLDMPSVDLALHDKLAVPVTVEYRDTPLEEAIRDLAQQASADIRLDRRALQRSRIRERQPVTLQIREQPLITVLNYLLPQLGLGWQIRNGVLWVTDREQENDLITALYDVRDLCRDENESQALSAAVQSQMPGVYEDEGGDGVLDFGKPGAMIVWVRAADHRVLLDLLEKYRFALRQSKLRQPSEKEDEVKTLYYRLHANVAKALSEHLAQLVVPESWQSAERPDAVGTLLMLESPPELQKIQDKESVAVAMFSERKVLIIKQRQSTHTLISELIQRIENGDPETRGSHGMNGMGGGMGGGMGFGGGMFSIPPLPSGSARRSDN